MDGHSYINWNLPNWITVFIMATLGYAIVSSGVSLVKSRFS